MKKPTANLYTRLVQNDKNYNNKQVVKRLIILKNLKDDEDPRRHESLEDLYFLMSRAILKSINGFYSYARKHGVKEDRILHSTEDVAVEFYLVLDTCVRNINMKYRDSFHFFYNKALLRASVRLFEKNYKKHSVVIQNTENNSYLLQERPYQQHISFNEIDLEKNFSEEEIQVIEAKVKQEKLADFFKRTKMSNERYYEILGAVKVKLQKLYQDEYRRIQSSGRPSKVELQCVEVD